MVTAVLSDLHLGTEPAGPLGREEIRRRLFAEIERADRVILLGDVLELRALPVAQVVTRALPFLEELGEMVGDRSVVFVPGNHDHQLAVPWLERQRASRRPRPLGLESVVKPGRADLLGRLAARMGVAEVGLAYPGTWLRADTYATHGHYLDCHMTVPRVECLAIAAIRRMRGGLPGPSCSAEDYEAILAPLYAFAYSLAQFVVPGSQPPGVGTSSRMWARVHACGGRDLRGRLLGGVAIPAAVRLLNRLGLGPFSADLSGIELRRAGLRAIGDVAERLGVAADHLIFGHTHRAGPLSGDQDWVTPSGIALTNAGSWVYEPALLSGEGPANPYWPGVVALVGDSGPPQLIRPLSGLDRADLAPAPH